MGVLKSLLEITITVYIGYVCIYNFVLSIAGLFYRRKSLSKDELNTHFKRRFAVFIPSYKEDGVIVEDSPPAVLFETPRDPRTPTFLSAFARLLR